MLTRDRPFVLLDDAGTAAARLYRDPIETLVARTRDEVAACLAAARAAVKARGLHAAGCVAPVALDGGAAPAAWFGLFETVERASGLPDGAGVWASVSADGACRIAGDPLALHARLRGVGGGMVGDGAHLWLMPGDAAGDGTIGWIAPDGGEAWVAAAAILVTEGAARADGVAAAAIGRACARLDLDEAMRFTPAEGMPELERHLAHMKESADALGFAFDRHDARNELQAATFRLRAPARVRLRAARGGRIAVEVRPLPPGPAGPVTVPLVPLPLDPADFRLRHGTSDRGFGDGPEAVFVRRDGLVTEGNRANLFVRRTDGMLLTPPLALGLRPGVLRARLLEEGAAVEAEIAAAALGDGFLLGDAVRGLFAARLPR